ncbi:MAG: hypothetical protein RLZZ419_150, partial [Pseudomonadota bacterium]
VDLIGARLAISSETEDDVALSESLIKSLVSGDPMSAIGLYCAPVRFTPQFKLMMLGNHKPIIRGTDDGIWRRIRLVPFNKTFTSSERDPFLTEKLRKEIPHILAWMVEGCLEWQKNGLQDIPKAIMKSTNEYKVEQVLAAMKERAKLADIDDETRSNILVNKKGAMISPFFIDQINIKMAARSRTRCLCRPSHPMGRYHALHASVP